MIFRHEILNARRVTRDSSCSNRETDSVQSRQKATDMNAMSQNKTTNITATCEHCRTEVGLRPSGLHMVLYDNGANGYYEFFCPRCTELNQKAMDFGIVRILRDAGVKATVTHVPLEVVDRAPDGGSPKIASDDVLDFYLDLQKTDYVAALADKAA